MTRRRKQWQGGQSLEWPATLDQGLEMMELVTPYVAEEQDDFSLPISQITNV